MNSDYPSLTPSSESADQADQTGNLDRRAVLQRGIAVALAAAGGTGMAAMALASDEDDDDFDDDHTGGSGGTHDDHDNSGPGNADDRDDHYDDDGTDGDHGGNPRDQPVQVGVTTVEIHDEIFVPNHIQIETGQTVTWVNQDDDDHTASGRGMDTGVMAPGQSGTFTFLEPGDYLYTCNFHPEMLGLVVVTGDSLASPEASPVALPMSAEVDIVDFAFEPAMVTVAVGAEVTWTNVGPTAHSVRGDWADSNIMDAGDEFSFTFEEPGTYEYICALHPAMTGTIEVREAGIGTPVAAGTPLGDAADEATVDIVDFAFEPTEVRVAVGGTVSWTNTGAAPHTATGDSFDSDIIDPGGNYSFTFDEAGEFEYVCPLHPNMVGT
ncbi:MAG: cupredoxin domain-containing protein, partial [Chloroflexota bacterium]|nr:cupredoxin domain-containing protein [Chloroflexota bacterium]